jgi:hypothetical protein
MGTIYGISDIVAQTRLPVKVVDDGTGLGKLATVVA